MWTIIGVLIGLFLVGCERYCPTVMTYEGEDVRVEYIDGTAHYYQLRLDDTIRNGQEVRTQWRIWLEQDDECGWRVQSIEEW